MFLMVYLRSLRWESKTQSNENTVLMWDLLVKLLHLIIQKMSFGQLNLQPQFQVRVPQRNSVLNMKTQAVGIPKVISSTQLNSIAQMV